MSDYVSLWPAQEFPTFHWQQPINHFLILLLETRTFIEGSKENQCSATCKTGGRRLQSGVRKREREEEERRGEGPWCCLSASASAVLIFGIMII